MGISVGAGVGDEVGLSDGDAVHRHCVVFVCRLLTWNTKSIPEGSLVGSFVGVAVGDEVGNSVGPRCTQRGIQMGLLASGCPRRYTHRGQFCRRRARIASRIDRRFLCGRLSWALCRIDRWLLGGRIAAGGAPMPSTVPPGTTARVLAETVLELILSAQSAADGATVL